MVDDINCLIFLYICKKGVYIKEIVKKCIEYKRKRKIKGDVVLRIIIK